MNDFNPYKEPKKVRNTQGISGDYIYLTTGSNRPIKFHKSNAEIAQIMHDHAISNKKLAKTMDVSQAMVSNYLKRNLKAATRNEILGMAKSLASPCIKYEDKGVIKKPVEDLFLPVEEELTTIKIDKPKELDWKKMYLSLLKGLKDCFNNSEPYDNMNNLSHVLIKEALTLAEELK